MIIVTKIILSRILALGAVLFVSVAGSAAVFAVTAAEHWVPAPVHFKIQYPYNESRSSRYQISHGVYHLEVYRDDKPFSKRTRTKPRTEQRFLPDYSSHSVLYASDMMVPAGTNGTCVFQIHTGNAYSHRYGSTAFMLFWYMRDGGSLHDYSGRELAGHLTGKWFHLQVRHDVKSHVITVWINGRKAWSQHDNGAPDFYMKDGVYAQHGASRVMQVYIKDIRIWTR